MKFESGFSLIEIMIALVIIGILAGIAIPSYQSSVLRGNRSEGMQTLLEVAQNQEVLFSQTNAYSTNALPFAPTAATLASEKGYYLVSVANGSCGSDACFIATATAQGHQAKDTDCLTLTIDNLGNRSSTPLGNTCW